MKTQQKNLILGVLVADAAALGLHWLYDLERMKQLMKVSEAVFRSPSSADFEGEVGYFAHEGKQSGEQSHYGESFLLYLNHLQTHQSFNLCAMQQAFISKFGAGGTYSGYIDKPTRVTLENLSKVDFSSSTENEHSEPSGADDHQIPALTSVAALCAFNNQSIFDNSLVETAIRMTNNNDLAVASGLYFTAVLKNILRGESIAASFMAAVDLLPEELKDKINQALSSETLELDEAAAIFGQTCDLKATMPLCAYILTHTKNYEEAVINNILAGGDSCGRAIMLGAIAGAYYGLGSDEGIPYDWIIRLNCQEDLVSLLS